MTTSQLPVAVSVDWLNQNRDQIVLADVRWYLDGRSGQDAYREGHIPGAVFVDVDRHLAAPASPDGGRHPLPTPDNFARDLGELGIGDDSTVVAYDDSGGATAARLVWLLRALGSRAALLDGGIQAWPGELEQGTVQPQPARRTPRPWPAERIATQEEVTALASSGSPGYGRSVTLVDARARERFTGESPAPVDARPGHIPGARNAPWQDNLTAQGHLASPEQLRDRFVRMGLSEGDPVIGYCGSGVTACHTLLAVEHAGLGPGRLYPGSWSVWGADPQLPAETGDP
ncbi:sulfurtransferase [Lipingzhangella sp. LS1_29]|uniref:Sulfurtransferase n=1 Tax=Lipingzhangella rawalii TaxID=2055835 RepID=A0ABU2H3J0_9ACTN|nr:sulfurtransferase [Lipingzhangella rawalii]MDS1269873.1 sulfurtransferase [Lipingzhangella rawalii]